MPDTVLSTKDTRIDTFTKSFIIMMQLIFQKAQTSINKKLIKLVRTYGILESYKYYEGGNTKGNSKKNKE